MITYQKNNNLYMFKNIIKAFQIEKIVSLNINITKKNNAKFRAKGVGDKIRNYFR